jgi:hypothetical protein
VSEVSAQLPGIEFDLPADEYRKRPGINISTLKSMSVSPAHYFTEMMRVADEPTEAQIIGKITHSAILEEDFDDFHVRPLDMSFATKEGKAWRDAHSDKPIIHQETAGHIAGMLNSVKSHPLASKLLRGVGNNEVSGWAMDKPTGLLLKGRADRLTQDDTGKTTIVDLKTIGYAEGDKEGFAKALATWSYHRQAAHYLDIFEASFFIFVAVEKLPPYAVACYQVDDEDIAFGRFQNLRDLRAVATCRESGEWPAYGNDIVTVKLPHWAKKKVEI